MNKELICEITEEIALLVNSGFYNTEEIEEIIEEQFIDEDISHTFISKIVSEKSDEKLANEEKWETETSFDRLKLAFEDITSNGIISIHNGGYDLSEGIQDAFEVFHHLESKKIIAKGFCFYTFQDIEEAIKCEFLNIAFGDFEGEKENRLAIGNKIVRILKDHKFSIQWNGDIDTAIKIKPLKWEKRFDNEEYEMEGAFNSYLKNQER